MSNRQVGPVAKELIAAKKRIEDQENWWDGHEIQRGSKMCALGAAAVDSPIRYKLYRELHRSARELFDLGYADVVNDRLGFQSVHQMYDHAIARAISEGK